jgi:hypothetical protein
MSFGKVNILFVVTSMAAGGLETYLLNILSVIEPMKFKATIAYTGYYSDWFEDELKALGVETIFCPNSRTQLFAVISQLLLF